MIGIGSYKNWKLNDSRLVSVSSDGGERVGFNGDRCAELAPSQELMDEWNYYKVRCDNDVLERIFVRKYYEQNLQNLDAEDLYGKLNNKIIVDYDDSPVVDIVAVWLNLLLGIELTGVMSVDFECVLVEREFNENIIKALDEVMREKMDMHHFNSLQSAYLFEKSVVLEKKASLLYSSVEPREFIIEKSGLYRQKAAFLRCDAEEAEEKYFRGEGNEVLSFERLIGLPNSADLWIEEQGHRLYSSSDKVNVIKKQRKEINGQQSLY